MKRMTIDAIDSCKRRAKSAKKLAPHLMSGSESERWTREGGRERVGARWVGRGMELTELVNRVWEIIDVRFRTLLRGML